ncbi:MAG: DUF4091 domain-containing protein [Clostridia bacterium]|nr:DUF4091 domain-containing protein [Clostridia bacterium]
MAEPKFFQFRMLSSLAKVFHNRIYGLSSRSAEAAQGQEISFQIAFRVNAPRYTKHPFRIAVSSPLADQVALYRVGNVPSRLPVYPERQDKNYLTNVPGLFPDPLFPLEQDTIQGIMGSWTSLWVSVKIPADCPAGNYPVQISFLDMVADESVMATMTYRITVHAVSLPAQKLIFTQWFHCDCIADVHGVPVFSEAHWALIGKYMRLAAEHGMNMILTPVVTPPLDTAVGGERPTVQLVDIEKNGDRYTFGFDRLQRYVEMALSYGIRYFEISHLFTQWGAAHAPKVVATVNGKEQRIFGWETDACGEEYASFLRQFVPATLAYLKSLGLAESQIYFHVSDEPRPIHLEAYQAAHGILIPLIGGCKHMDAMSKYDFYKNGLVQTPVISIDHIEPFVEAKVSGLWAYYCCSQCVNVSNRFFAMPSSRNRIIGVLLYKYDIAGFLQWGYNFYYSQRSVRKLNPYFDTDADMSFPSGDSFSVYPYGDDVIPSLRQKVFANALEDIRLLERLEEKLGRDRVIEELDRVAGEPLTFTSYPIDERFFERLYQFIFENL